jgi:thioredoxin 1
MDKLEILIIGAIALLLLLPYLLMRFSAYRSVGRPAPPLDEQIAAGVDGNRPLYLYFMSERCSMCRVMTPRVEQLGGDDANVITINISQNPELATGFGVQGTPTLMVVSDGRIQRVKLGALSERKLARFFDRPE